MAEWMRLPISDGTDRASRAQKALKPDYFQVDELLYEELLSMGAAVASSIDFRNLDNEVDGDWGELFTADEAVIMAMIVSTNPRRLEAEFTAIHPSHYARQLNFVVELARKFDFWLGKLSLSGNDSGNLLAEKIASLITGQLAPALHQCLRIHRKLVDRDTRGGLYDVSSFSSVWQAGAHEEQDEQPANTERSSQQIRSLFHTFNNAVEYIRTLTPTQLNNSLRSGRHEPTIALFMVFLRLYQRAQERVNSFTGRHLSFYYDEVLQTANRSSRPASAYLHLEKMQQGGRVLIPEGTRFSPGKDGAKNEVSYCAESTVLISDATVSDVATLYLQQDSLVSPEFELGYVTRVKSSWLPHDKASAEDSPQSWPLFGANGVKRVQGNGDDARIGLAIASPVLALSQGRRQIELNFTLGRYSTTELERMVDSLSRIRSAAAFHRQCGRLFSIYLLSGSDALSTEQKAVLIERAESVLSREMADEIHSLFTQDWQGLFFKLFSKVFKLSLTGAEGWLDVEDYSLTPMASTGETIRPGFTLSFTLWHSEAPVVAYDTALHGDELPVSQPVLRCQLNPESNFFPYSLFQGLPLEKVDIIVDVQGITDIVAYNQHGQLDPTKPFHPFGPIPALHTKFVFGNREVASKKLTALSLDLQWGQLPKLSGGFATHYQAYQGDYFNDLFVCKASVLTDGQWYPKGEDSSSSHRLFESAGGSSKLLSKSRIELAVANYLNANSDVLSAEHYRYTAATRNGFFRLELTGPEGAFGHEDYPKLLTATLSLNARLKNLKKLKPLPNPPYTPVLDSLSMNYRAEASIDLGRSAPRKGEDKPGKIIHLHPFGVDTLSPLRGDPLLPPYHQQGNLMIGLSARDVVGELTLFFQLAKESDHHNQSVGGPISWYYLSDNGWERLPERRVLADTTDNFITSGIVTLNIPSDISRRNSVMPTGRYWLRATTVSGSSGYPELIAVKTHAIKVTRQLSTQNDPPHVTYDKHKWTLLDPIAGVAGVKQAGDLMGGAGRETDVERQMRISERLHHKNRALSPWDYEHLVLERFPDIAKVKCFPALSSKRDGVTPGSVLVVVLPELHNSNDEGCIRAYLDREKLLQIKKSVQAQASSFASIEVRNPIYEMVQIRCTVKFRREDMQGGFHERLNRDLSEFICPWSERGYKVRFGWCIRKKDVESYIRDLDYVDYVTNVSMLHITTRDQKHYCMSDTAASGGETMVSPRYPWSLPVPAGNHFIETTDVARTITAEITGINELEIGSTFIIDGGCNNG